MLKSKGTVKWFNPTKGFGFIEQENGEDIFVHYSSFNDAASSNLNEGESVEFEVQEGAKGPKASNVVRL